MDFLELLEEYAVNFPAHKELTKEFKDLYESKPEISLYRDCFNPGHFTGSAVCICPEMKHFLLLHHKKLDIWIQPGGHADGEDDLESVARRELEEETGIKTVNKLYPGIFSIDRHLIPARKNEAEHYHYDVTFIFQALDINELSVDPSESHAFKWEPIGEITPETHERTVSLYKKRFMELF